MLAVQIDSLTKVYKSFSSNQSITALRDLTLFVNSGEIFGLLGPNGAGKTTLIKILLGICFPTNGTASILERDILDYEVKSKVGYLPENHKYPNYLNGEEVLRFFGKLSGISDKTLLQKNIDYNLELVGMTKWKKTKIKKYSKGMLQRLGLAQALLNDPELIFLDEPTDGVDPIGRKEIREILLNLKSQGKTIFLNSHLLSEVEMITDRVAILNKGILIKEGNVSELTRIGSEYQFTLADETPEDKIKLLPSVSEHFRSASLNLPNRNKSIGTSKKLSVKVENQNELNQLIDKIRENGILIESITPVKSSLEDLFINVIKESDLSSDKNEKPN